MKPQVLGLKIYRLYIVDLAVQSTWRLCTVYRQNVKFYFYLGLPALYTVAILSAAFCSIQSLLMLLLTHCHPVSVRLTEVCKQGLQEGIVRPILG